MLSLIELKAKMLCEGVNADTAAEELFRQQNPSNVKRGGLSSGGKMKLGDKLFVNAPFYRKREVDLKVIADPTRERGVLICQGNEVLCKGEALLAPKWYGKKADGFPITKILTAHNRQLAGAVYEDCELFGIGEECQFCVMNHSLKDETFHPPKDKQNHLVLKAPSYFLSALQQIPVRDYGGLTLNGGMTLHPGRGMELIGSTVQAVHMAYPDLPIAVELAPPADLNWIDRLAKAGVSSMMMNLECWDPEIRARLIPGKNKYCDRLMYLKAFERALKVLGPGRVTTCFVVGTEPVESLKEGIREVVGMGAIPSPLAGRYFEDVPNYPFAPNADYRKFLDILAYAAMLMRAQGILSTDKAGCVACGMCDLIRDL